MPDEPLSAGGIDRLAPVVALLVGLLAGAGAVGRWATAPRASAGPPSVRAPAAPSSRDDPAPRAAASGPAGPSGEAEAAKVLARMLRRKGRFDAANAAAERYRRLRLSPSP